MATDPEEVPAPESRAGHPSQDADDRPAEHGDPPGRDAGGGRDTVRDVLCSTGSALFGPDVRIPRKPLLLWGRRSREHRRRRQEILDRARARREQVWRGFTSDLGPPTPASGPWQPVDRRRNIAVSAGLIGLVCAVFVVAMRYADRPATPSGAAALTTVVAEPTTTVASTPSTQPSATPLASGTSGVPVRPIPSGGVSALTPPAPTPLDPASIILVTPPGGDATASELGSPDGAVRAWLTRTCSFDWHDPFAAAESRGRSAMTEAGWQQADPGGNAVARASWSATVAAREIGRCAAPIAIVDPEAPRSDTAVIVIGSVARVVTGPGEAPYVETVDWTGWVRRGPDGLWRVDIVSVGG